MTERHIERAVVTGASSMIGSWITRCLIREGIRVTAVVRPGSSNIKNLSGMSERLSIYYCDIRDIESLKETGLKADAFFHLSWSSTRGSGRNDESAQRLNVDYTLKALKTAKAIGCRVFIGAGSQAEYGPFEGRLAPDTPMHPVTAYGKMKLEAEIRSREEAEKLGIDHIWPRILSVYGPGDNPENLVASAVIHFLKDEKMAFTPGDQIWDYLYSEDCAEAFIALAKRGISGKAYVLGKGEPLKLRDYITEIYRAVSPEQELVFGERPYNENQVMYLLADISDLVKDTGYIPETSFKEGIQKTVAWFKEELMKE